MLNNNDYNFQTGNIPVPVECIRVEHKVIPESERSFFFNQPAKFKPSLLGINSHVQQSIEQGFVDLNRLWFADFLRPNVTEFHDNEAVVTAFFRVVRRTETLDRNFLDSKIYEYQLDSGGRATHLVEQVGYGSELICSMRRTVDWRRETKDSVEENIYLAAKAYFERIFGPKLNNNVDPPTELEKVTCRLLSSLEDVQPTETSFQQSCEFLRDVINFKEDNQPAKLWRPIYIVRYQIPGQIETRIFLDKISDKRLKIERKWHWILKESRRILRHPYLNQIPPIARAVYQFLDLLEPIEKEIKQFSSMNIIGNKHIQEQVGNEIKIIIDSVLLSDMVNWLIQRRCDIDAMCLLFNGKQMAMYDFAEIESRPLSTIERRARVFVLKVEYNPDPLMKRVQNLIGDPNPIIKIPVFPVMLSGKERLGVISKAFHEFSEEAHWCSNEKNNYQIGLVPVSSALDDAAIKTILYPAIEFKTTCLPFNAQSASSTEPERTHKEESLPCRPTSVHNLKNSQIHLKTPATPKQNPYEKVSYLLMKTFCQVFND